MKIFVKTLSLSALLSVTTLITAFADDPPGNTYTNDNYKTHTVTTSVTYKDPPGSSYILAVESAKLYSSIPITADDGATPTESTAYVRGSTPEVSATFKVTTLGPISPSSVKVKASGPDGIAVPETTISAFAGGADLLKTECTGTLPILIKYYDATGNEAAPFQLDWQMSLNNGTTWTSVGSTKHTVYVTLNERRPSALPYETLYYIACKYADGQTTKEGTTSSIQGHFAGLEVKTVGGTILTYYATYNTPFNSTAALLTQGTSRCQGWGEFFLDVCKIHGIHAGLLYVVWSIYAEGLIIKDWTFHGPGTSGITSYPHINQLNGTNMLLTTSYNWGSTVEVTFNPGSCIPAQGNPTPPALFANHVVVLMLETMKLYDPSYGQMYKDEAEMEGTVIDGYWIEVLTPHFLAFRRKETTCSIKAGLLSPYE